MHEGDFQKNQTVDFKFTTTDATGAPTALSSGALSVYKANDAAQTTTGVTLTADFDGLTGLNHVRILTTDSFYATGNSYQVILTAGTVGGVSVVGYVVGTFSIENRWSMAHRLPQYGRSWYVTTTGSDSNDGLSWERPKLTPAAAITAAVTGATVYGGAGTFDLGTGGLDFGAANTKTVHFRGSGAGATIIKSKRNLVTQGVIMLHGDGSVLEGYSVNCFAADAVPVTLSQAAGTATAFAVGGHPYATGETVTISGATPAAYNGAFTVTVLNGFQFTYTVPGGTASPATGTITATMAIYQGGTGMNHTVDNAYSHGTIRNVQFIGERATDALYISAFGAGDQITVVEGCHFETGWDGVRAFYSNQLVDMRDCHIIAQGGNVTEPTQSRGIVMDSARLKLTRVSMNVSGGTSINRGIQGDALIFSGGGNVIRTSGTGAIDVHMTTGTVYLSGSDVVDQSKITLVGGTLITSFGKAHEGIGVGQLDLTDGRPGIDWGKVSNPTTTNAFTNTTINGTASGSPVTITPLQASVANPFYATRDLPKLPAGAENIIVWVVTDALGAAVDLSGKTIRLVAYSVEDVGDDEDTTIDDTIEAAFKYETGGDGLVVGGDDDNEITLTHDQTKTATPGDYRYWLLNVTDRTPIAKGKMPIEPAAWDT